MSPTTTTMKVLLALSSLVVSVVASHQVNVNQCYHALRASDTNQDYVVTRDEYVHFAKLLTPPGLLDNDRMVQFSDLPLAFQAAFTGTACLCSIPAYGGNAHNTTCCYGSNAVLMVIPTVQPESDASSEQQQAYYLQALCSRTMGAVDSVSLSTRMMTFHHDSNEADVMTCPVVVTQPTLPQAEPQSWMNVTTRFITTRTTTAPRTIRPIKTSL